MGLVAGGLEQVRINLRDVAKRSFFSREEKIRQIMKYKVVVGIKVNFLAYLLAD